MRASGGLLLAGPQRTEESTRDRKGSAAGGRCGERWPCRPIATLISVWHRDPGISLRRNGNRRCRRIGAAGSRQVAVIALLPCWHRGELCGKEDRDEHPKEGCLVMRRFPAHAWIMTVRDLAWSRHRSARLAEKNAFGGRIGRSDSSMMDLGQAVAGLPSFRRNNHRPGRSVRAELRLRAPRGARRAGGGRAGVR